MTLIAEVRELLDESTGSTFWVEEQIYDALNEAIVDVYSNTRHEYGTATITFTASNAYLALPSSLMIPQYIVGTKGRYFPTTKAKLEQWNRDWRAEGEDYPKHFVVTDIDTIMAFPAPDLAYEFTVHGVPWPSCGEIADGAEDITGVPNLLRLALTKRTVAELLEFTQPALADQYLAEAAQLEHDFKIQLRNRQGHNIRRLKPGTLFTRAQSGVVVLGRKYS